jgi:Ca2+-binding RTX toxin-like protein
MFTEAQEDAMAIQGTVPGSGYGNPYVDSLITGYAWGQPNLVSGGEIRVAFGVGSIPGHDGEGYPWLDFEQAAFHRVLDSFEAVCNVTFVSASSFADADIVWYSVDGSVYEKDSVLADHGLPDGEQSQVIGRFRYDTPSWNYLDPGGAGYSTILHEVLHGLGLDHPHLDPAPDSPGHTAFPGVDDKFDTGDHGLNQGIWTVMSYNRGWDPADVSLYTGHAQTPMAFDVAALQAMYGVNTSHHTGDEVYHLGVDYDATGYGWFCIWDAGGDNDTISAAGMNTDAIIDLHAATLVEGDPDAGGRPSYYVTSDGIPAAAHGYTIANGVVIENATGGHGNDQLLGNSAWNTLTGGAGADRLDGGDGFDTAVYDNTHETMQIIDMIYTDAGTLDAAGDTFISIERILGSDGEDWIAGTNADESLLGRGGNDRLWGRFGADVLDGGSGTDLAGYESAVTADLMFGYLNTGEAAGDQYIGIEGIFGSFDQDDLRGDDNDNDLYGNRGSDLLHGRGGVDEIWGDRGSDTLWGDQGDDTLDGGSGNDTMYGGLDNDTYFVDDEGDVVIEYAHDAGTDTVIAKLPTYQLGDAVEDLTMTMRAGDITGIGNELANTITAIDTDFAPTGPRADLQFTLDGQGGADSLIGSVRADVLIGGDGDDWLSPGSEDWQGNEDGADILVFADGWDHDTVVGFAVGEDVLDLSQVSGLTSFGQLMIASDENGDAKVSYGDNSITLEGVSTVTAASFRFAATTVTGSDGFDIVYAGASTVANGFHFSVAGSGVEAVVGNAGNDVLDGSGTADYQTMLFGGDGDDVLIPDSGGSYTLQGGAGNDTAIFAGNRGDYTIMTNPDGWYGWTTVTDNASDAVNWLQTVERLQFADGTIDTPEVPQPEMGTAAGDVMTAGEGGATLHGLSGNDQLTGGMGNDVIDGGIGVDELRGGAGNDTLFADSTDVIIDGGEGYDSVYADDSQGAAGALHFRMADSNVEFVYGGLGKDVIDATGVTTSVQLVGQWGDDVLTGGAGDDELLGDEFLVGGGNDMLDGGAGNDWLTGGLGSDTAVFHGARSDYTVTALADGGYQITDSVAGRDGTDSVWSVEFLQFADGTLADGTFLIEPLTGTEGNDTIAGGDGDERIRGLGGNDTLSGGGGDDVIDGGADRNDLSGGAGDDTLIGGSTFDTMDGGDGDDTLIGTGGQTTMFGGDGDDTMTGSLTSNNAMYAGLGNDTMTGGEWTDWMYDVWGGNDVMRGGGGYDVIVDHQGVNLLYGEGGDDWIISATDQGSLLDGGEGDDTLFASFGGNTLLGGAGRDILEVQEGGAIANILTGGADADTFVYRAGVSVAANVIVTDFEDGVDHIGLRFQPFDQLTITDSAEGAVITYYDHSPMVLAGVSASQITQDDFMILA